jgi:serine/threonine protein kinase
MSRSRSGGEGFAPEGFAQSAIVAMSAFHLMLRVTRGGRDYGCRRLTPRGISEPEMRLRVETEADVLRALGGRGAPLLEESGTDEHGPYAVHAWVPGETLVFYTQMEISPERAVFIGRAAFEAMADLHEAQGGDGEALRVVHGDVRPENVIIAAGERHATFVDFGLARLRDGPKPEGGGVLGHESGGAFRGAPQYVAPEVARGEESGQAADVFSLAMCMLHVTTRTPPRLGGSLPELLMTAADLPPVIPEADLHGAHAALLGAIAPCLSTIASARPTAREVAVALSRLC